MTQGKKPFFTFEDLKKAALKGGFDKVQDFGQKLYDAGADVTKNVLDAIDKAQIENSQKGLNNPVLKTFGIDKQIKADNEKRKAAIKQRELDDQKRNKDLQEIKLENEGKSTRIASKDRIIKNLASNEVKAIKQIQPDLNNQVDKAIEERIAILREAGEPENKIQSWVAMQRSSANNQVKEIAKNEAQASQAAISDLAQGGNVNPFAIDRANQQFEKLQGKDIDLKRQLTTNPLVEGTARTVKPIADLYSDTVGLVNMGLDQTVGRFANAALGKGFIPGNEYQRQQETFKAREALLNQATGQVGGQEFYSGLDQDQSFGGQAQRFIGQSIPFVLAPETALSRRAGVNAAKMLRPGMLRNTVQAAVKEGVQDTPLSLLQTVGELNRNVQSGQVTLQEALQQAPSAIAVNAIADFAGGGALRAAGDLASKGLKNATNLQNPVRSQQGSMAVEAPPAKPEAPKPLTPNDIRKAQYQQSISRLNELTPKQKELTQAITQAQAEGDFARVGQLKQEAKAVKAEAKYLKQTVNNLELEGLQKANQASAAKDSLPSQPVNSDVENLKKILGVSEETDLLQNRLPDTNNNLRTRPPQSQNPRMHLEGLLENSPNKTQKLQPEGASIEETQPLFPSLETPVNNVNTNLNSLKQETAKASNVLDDNKTVIETKTPSKPVEKKAYTVNLKGNVRDNDLFGMGGSRKNYRLREVEYDSDFKPQMDGSKQYLDVPFESKDYAKKYGAKWDRDAKSWYVEGEVPERLKNFEKAPLKMGNDVSQHFQSSASSKHKYFDIEAKVEEGRIYEQGNGQFVRVENGELKPIGKQDAVEFLKENQAGKNSLSPKNLVEIENKQKAQSTEPLKTPRNQAELEQTYKTTFGLDEPKAKAAAVVTDRIFDTIARRKGITKEAAYAEVGFKKSDLSEVGEGAKFQNSEEYILRKGAKSQDSNAFTVGDNTNVGKVEEVYGDQIKANGRWYNQRIVQKTNAETPEQATQRIKNENLLQRKQVAKELSKKIGKRPNEDGTFTLYHGTSKQNATLIKQKGFTEGSYFSIKKEGTNYGDSPLDVAQRKFGKDATVLSVKVDARDLESAAAGTEVFSPKTIKLNKEGFFTSIFDEEAKFQGAQTDTPEFKNWFGEIVAFEPTQIKSAIGNSGKFDPNNPDIRFQSEKGAMESLEGGKKVIHALTDPNVSTPLHEIAHVYEEVLTKGEKDTILEWAGSKEWDTNASEKFARGFERYLAEGKAPIPALKEIFEDFKDWLADIYKGITGSEIDLKLNKQMRKIYDDMIALDPKLSENIKTPKNQDELLKGIDNELASMGYKKGAINRTVEYLNKYPELAKDFIQSKKITSQAELEQYLSNRHGRARKPVLEDRRMKLASNRMDYELDKLKDSLASENPTIRESRTVQTPKITSDPKLSESLNAKVLNKEQDLKGIRRVIYEPKAFQEAQRNPKNLSTLSDAYGDKLPKSTEKIISEASKIKKELNDLDASLKDNKAQLAKIMRDAKVDSVDVEVGGQKYTVKRPTKSDDQVVFNTKGRLAREELIKQFQDEGKLGFDADQGINLAIQTEAKGASRATKYGTKNLEDAAKEHIKFLREAAVLGEKEAVLKEKIMSDIVPKLENGGLDHVWRNNEADTSFAIKRNPSKSNFKTGEAEAEFKAREAELKADIDNVKIRKGEYGSAGVSEAQALGINRRSKAGKAEYEEFQTKVRRDIEAKTALDEGIETPKQAEAVIESGLEQFKKLDDTKGKQFAFNPLTAAALLDSDGILIGTRLFKPLIDKGLSKQGELVSQAYEMLKTAVGRAESYATRLRNSKIPAFRKLIEDYDNLAAREFQAEGFMRTKFSPEQVERIGAAIKEHGFRELESMINSGKLIDGIESADDMEILKAFMQNRRKRADLIKDSIERAKKAGVDKGDLVLLESFYKTETATIKGTGAAIQGVATDLLYFKALWNNLRSTTLAATDPLTKLIPEYGLGKTVLSLKDVMDSKVRNSPLFKAYNAGDSGTYIDALAGRKAEGIGKVWESVKKASIFGLVTEASQDMGLLAHARSFNDYWKQKTGQTIDILNDFDGMNEASQEFALMHNAITNKLYGAGKGAIYKSEIEANNFLKPFMAFMGEPLRFQKRMSEWRSVMAKANEPGATALEKEAGKKARNSMVSFVTTTVLLGGSRALKNMGGAVGASYALALNLMSPEEREQTENFLNAAQLTRYINVDLGEKLGVSLLQRGEGESFADVIKQIWKGESRIAMLDVLKQFPKDFEKMENYSKAGNKEQSMLSGAKMFLGAAPGTVEKILKFLKQEPMSVWVETSGGNLKEEFKKVEIADILSYSSNETDIKKSVRMEEKAKESAIGKVEKVGKKYRLTGESREFREYVNLLDSKRYKLNPSASRQELEQKLLKAAYTKQNNQAKKMDKFAPKSSAQYLSSQSQETLVKRIAASGGTEKQKAIQSLQNLKAQSKKAQKRKFGGVLGELEEIT